MPIVDLLAISNTHFQKLKHFIHMQLPSGFPVKIGDLNSRLKKITELILFRLFRNSLIPRHQCPHHIF